MKSALLLLTMLALAACGGQHAEGQAAAPATPPPTAAVAPAPAPAPAPPPGGATASGCPMMLRGVTSNVTDTDRGVAITFTAPPDEVPALRARVHHMAEHMAQHGGSLAAGGCPCGMGPGHMQGGMQHGMTETQGMPMPRADTRAEDVEGGARLLLTASNPADVAALQSHVHMHMQNMQHGECPMM